MSRKHRDEMIRFANSPEGTKIWFRRKEGKWRLKQIPAWDDNVYYVVDDKYAELRKEHIDTGRPIQCLTQKGVWVTLDNNIKLTLPSKLYRVKPDEAEYFYQWGKLFKEGVVSLSAYMSDEYAERFNYNEEYGWRKMENSKILWEK